MKVIFDGTKTIVEVDPKDLLYVDGHLVHLPTKQFCKKVIEENDHLIVRA